MTDGIPPASDDRVPFAWASRSGVSAGATAVLYVALANLETSRCARCGRFRRDSRVPRHICPVTMRRKRK